DRNIPLRGIVVAGEGDAMPYAQQDTSSSREVGEHPGDHARREHQPGHDHDAEHGRHAGHDHHAGHDPELFRRRFWVTLLLAIPLVVTSEMVMDWFGYELDLPLMKWYGPVLGSVVFWWGGWPFLVGGFQEAR